MEDNNKDSMKTVSVEYGKDNRFPFYTRDNSNVTICFDDHEGLYELDFIFGKIVDRFPSLDPVPFYRRIGEIRLMTRARSITMLKSACDSLLGSIKELFMDEDFIHQMHDRWGFGIDKVLQTLYAVYGYYFYTSKRTANVIKKILDGYKRKPEH